MDFEERAERWAISCFGPKIVQDKVERSHRFMEEAIELVQACGTTKDEVLQLVDYVYNRPDGEIYQEVGGVLNTLALLCNAHDVKMMEAGHVELDRCWAKSPQIREKQANKPKFSPLPE